MSNTLFLCFVILCSFVMGDPQADALKNSPPKSCCNENEELKCVKNCPPAGTCQNRKIQFNCFNLEETICEEKCVCKNGFYKNPKGVCVTEAECNKCPGANEVLACGPACDNVCGKMHEMNQTSCPTWDGVCTEKCYCLETHARSSDGTCVLIEECDM